jgi:hypothetical protein
MASSLGAGFAMGPPELNLGPFRGPPYKGETPLNKNHSASSSPRRTRLTVEQKQAVRDRYYSLRDQWCMTLETSEIDWQSLFDLHWEMLEMERQHPWIKRAA